MTLPRRAPTLHVSHRSSRDCATRGRWSRGLRERKMRWRPPRTDRDVCWACSPTRRCQRGSRMRSRLIGRLTLPELWWGSGRRRSFCESACCRWLRSGRAMGRKGDADECGRRWVAKGGAHRGKRQERERAQCTARRGKRQSGGLPMTQRTALTAKRSEGSGAAARDGGVRGQERGAKDFNDKSSSRTSRP